MLDRLVLWWYIDTVLRVSLFLAMLHSSQQGGDRSDVAVR